MGEVCDSMSEQCHQYSRGEKPTCSPNKAAITDTSNRKYRRENSHSDLSFDFFEILTECSMILSLLF